MSTLNEIDETLSLYPTNSESARRITLMQCTSAYPADPADAHLHVIPFFAQRYPHCKIGYSDHTPNNYCAVAAVALGASVVEKHFTLDKSLPGPDHAASADSAELFDYIRAIRQTESALGNAAKRISPSEESMRSVSRKSLHFKTELKAGTRILREHLRICRPNDGLSPMDLPNLIGRELKANVSKDQALSWACFNTETR